MVTSVDRGLSATANWADLRRLFAESADYVVSNTGDVGYSVAAADISPSWPAGAPPTSFPGKLTALLHRKSDVDGRASSIGTVIFVPIYCELVHHLAANHRTVNRQSNLREETKCNA